MGTYTVNKFIAYFLPSVCLLCHKKTQTTINLCSICEPLLPWLTEHVCRFCAAPLDSDRLTPIILVCGRCQKKPLPVDRMIACFYYKPPIVQWIADLKFRKRLPEARLLGTLMARLLIKCYQDRTKPEAIIPVPLHRKRLRERGFNQSVELARPISRALNIPIRYGVIKRIINTPSQSSLPAKQRNINLRHVFTLTKSLDVNCVALIDDVITTGSTINALCQILRKAQVKEIHVWSCAHA